MAIIWANGWLLFLLFYSDPTPSLLRSLGLRTAVGYSAFLLVALAVSRYRAVRAGWRWEGVGRRGVTAAATRLAWGLVGFPVTSVFLIGGLTGVQDVLSQVIALPSWVGATLLVPGPNGFLFFWLLLVTSKVMDRLNLYADPVPEAPHPGS